MAINPVLVFLYVNLEKRSKNPAWTLSALVLKTIEVIIIMIDAGFNAV
jgi:hypothetical protein